MTKNSNNLDAAIFQIIKKAIPIREKIIKHKKNLLSIETELSKLKHSVEKNKNEIDSIQSKFNSSQQLTAGELQNHFTRIRFLKSENDLFLNKIRKIKEEKTEIKFQVDFLTKKIADFSVKEEKLNEIINFNNKKMKELKEELLSEEISELMSYYKLKS